MYGNLKYRQFSLRASLWEESEVKLLSRNFSYSHRKCCKCNRYHVNFTSSFKVIPSLRVLDVKAVKLKQDLSSNRRRLNEARKGDWVFMGVHFQISNSLANRYQGDLTHKYNRMVIVVNGLHSGVNRSIRHHTTRHHWKSNCHSWRFSLNG